MPKHPSNRAPTRTTKIPFRERIRTWNAPKPRPDSAGGNRTHRTAPTPQKLLQKRAVRTISGVSPIGILTKPYPCPGLCVYCPTEDRMPKSYMSNQPAAARAVRNQFHPFRQVHGRVLALEDSGHPTSKLEVIVMGGTWSFLPHAYQHWYIREIFRAANSFDKTQEARGKKQDFSAEKISFREIQKADWQVVLKLEKKVFATTSFAKVSQITDWNEAQKTYHQFLFWKKTNK